MKLEYAVVDIETTGGYAAAGGITEIAIRIFDGNKVIDKYDTLINPQKEIPISITSLTGITNDMLQGSPTFDKVANKIFDLLEGRIFVAHNVNFDYSFVKHHLGLFGYNLNSKKLCTVRLSRKIKPGFRSYSLGLLCTELNIPLLNRHRAGGDADATASLLGKLIEWDTEGHVAMMLKISSKEQALPPNLPKENFDALPQCPGVYYFKNRAGEVVYVGKAVNIKKRVASHFVGNTPNPQRQNFLRAIFSISFEKCGTELLALLLEVTEIKKLWPKYNRALKKYDPKFGLYCYEDRRGFLRLDIGKLSKNQIAIYEFDSLVEATNISRKLLLNFGLCPALCNLGFCTNDCFQPRLTISADNTCKSQINPQEYNRIVEEALHHLKNNQASFAIIDTGRTTEERSCIWVENGAFYGMGYFQQYGDLLELEDIKPSLSRYKSNYYMMQLVYNYTAKYPNKTFKIIAKNLID